MKRSDGIRLAVAFLLSFWLCPATAAAQEEKGRDPEDQVEIEGHFGFYTNLAFPTTRRENPAYTPFASICPDPVVCALRPDIRSRDVGWQGGFRASYDVTPRWAVEYGFSFTEGNNFRFTNVFIERPPTFAFPDVIIIPQQEATAGRLWIHSLNGVFHLRERGRWVPYVTGGVNAVSFGRGPNVSLVRGQAVFIFEILDRGEFNYNERFTRFGGNVGGGVKYYWRRHFGFRADARFLFTGSEFTQRGELVRQQRFPFVGPIVRFGPEITSQQRGLYSNLHVTFGVFGRF